MADDSTTTAEPIPTPAVSKEPAKAPDVAPEPKPAVAADGEKDAEGKAWFKGRMERERNKLLKELGIENTDDARAAISAYKAKTEAEKSEAEKLVEAKNAAEARAGQADSLLEIVKGRLSREMSGLSDEQKAAVTAIAGDDPAAQLKTIDAMAPVWAKPTETPAAEPVAEPAKAKDTGPGANTPPDTNTSPPNRATEFRDMRTKNPFQADMTLQEHGKACFETQ